MIFFLLSWLMINKWNSFFMWKQCWRINWNSQISFDFCLTKNNQVKGFPTFLQSYLIEITEKTRWGAECMGKNIRASVAEKQYANMKPSMPNDFSFFIWWFVNIFFFDMEHTDMQWNEEMGCSENQWKFRLRQWKTTVVFMKN